MSDTIFALSSGALPAAIAVVRISGPKAFAALRALGAADGPPRRAALRRLIDPDSGRMLDEALVLRFPGPNSATGEDLAELHAHGGPAVVAALLDTLGRQPGLRAADPGEFTRRAFHNGRLDLAQVEGLADLIDAETEAQRRQALDQMQGRLSALFEGWRDRLMRALAYMEADLDFSDEELPGDLLADIRPAVEQLIQAMRQHLADAGRAERVREGYRVVLLGPPNAGKSSLLNALAQAEEAIVSPTPGTTRDVLKVRLSLAGLPVTLIDTAGLRAAGGAIEAEGTNRARRAAAAADLILLVEAADLPPWPEAAAFEAGRCLRLYNKADLGGAVPPGALAVSAVTGEGLAALLARLTERLAEQAPAQDQVLLTRARHRAALEAAVAHLERFAGQGDLVLAAEDLRLAVRALGRVTGRVDVEDLLDIIFADFCIGK